MHTNTSDTCVLVPVAASRSVRSRGSLARPYRSSTEPIMLSRKSRCMMFKETSSSLENPSAMLEMLLCASTSFTSCVASSIPLMDDILLFACLERKNIPSTPTVLTTKFSCECNNLYVWVYRYVGGTCQVQRLKLLQHAQPFDLFNPVRREVEVHQAGAILQDVGLDAGEEAPVNAERSELHKVLQPIHLQYARSRVRKKSALSAR